MKDIFLTYIQNFKQDKILYVFLLSFSILFFSCEGCRLGIGTVYDKSTKRPLGGVTYKNVVDSDIHLTDSTGKYKLRGNFGACMPTCPDYDAEFLKKGYKTKVIKNPKGNIYLEVD
ncbi:MAG: hypothetical protein ACI7YS_01430 [Flavobacterium sp.]